VRLLPLPSSAATAPLWDFYYLSRRSIPARNLLVVAYMMLPEIVALKIIERLPESVQIDDLISAGTFGLMEAVAKFNPVRGIAFRTFATGRIRGAILDELRGIDHVSRLLRTRFKTYEAAKHVLLAELGRPPTRDELIAYLNISPEQFIKMEKAVVIAADLVSAERVIGENDHGDEATVKDGLAAPAWSDPAAAAERRDMVSFILRSLPARFAMFVSFYFIQGERLENMGKRFGLSESRMSQLTGKAIRIARSACAREAA
jgi:RNA polymerase sigma factor for flagellar operon FliA